MMEREKMLSGALYQACAPELAQARQRAKELCRRFNLEAVQDPVAGERLLRELLGAVGKDISIQPMFWCDYGCNIRMGSQIEINHNCVILDCAPVTFGDHVFIGPNCGFYTAGHPLDAATRNAGLEFARPITVGDNVWFGGNAAVLPGVTIGSGTVIGAGSVVSRDIPPNVVAAGNPCRVLRPICPGSAEEP
ncbi:MAG: sugar O-acetyltransferase [Oscillospiraceae bacterium]|nr:sugar O-acetyltransferase [Oscillospiraceae bacterium]